MNYIIDGFNLAFKIERISRLIRQGAIDIAVQQTVHFVSQKLNANKGRVLLIFDGQAHSHSVPPAAHGITIRFSKKPQLADDIIREFIRSTDNLQNWTVVSSDNEIRFTAQDHGARSITSKQFIQLVPRQSKKRGNKGNSEKPGSENIDIEYWKKIFDTGSAHDE